MIFAVSGCSQTNEHDMKNETTQETLQETEHDDIKESSDVIVSEQSIDTDSLIKEIREMINNSETSMIDPIEEIESDKDSAYYMLYNVETFLNMNSILVLFSIHISNQDISLYLNIDNKFHC